MLTTKFPFFYVILNEFNYSNAHIEILLYYKKVEILFSLNVNVLMILKYIILYYLNNIKLFIPY